MRDDEYIDAIMEELHHARAEFAKRFNYDGHAMVEYLMECEKEHPERMVELPLARLKPDEPRAA